MMALNASEQTEIAMHAPASYSFYLYGAKLVAEHVNYWEKSSIIGKYWAQIIGGLFEQCSIA